MEFRWLAGAAQRLLRFVEFKRRFCFLHFAVISADTGGEVITDCCRMDS